MVKNRRIVLQGRPPPRMTRQNYLKNRNKQLRNVQTSSRNSELVQSQNLKLHGCSSEPSLMKVSTKINSSPLLSLTSICSTTSITTEAATLTESAKSSNSSQNHMTAAHQLSVTDQTQPTLGMFKAAQLDLQLKPQLNPNSVINNFPISQFGQSWGSSSGRSFEHFLFSNYFILNSYLNFTT